MDSIDYYNKYAAAYYESTVDLDMSEALDRFIKYLPENAEVMDLGCGSGRDSLYLEEAGFYVTAVDGSEEMCKLAEINLGKEVLNIRFEDLDFDGVFDGIWACASLVHVEKDKMEGVLNRVFRALKPDGVLYMSFRFGDSHGFDNGRYYYDYTIASLAKVLQKSDDVETLEIWKSNDVRSERNTKWVNVIVKRIIE
ncbi:class I SAM-dependent methyltransferase [Diplocloster agilis]|uniref:class I SAM-dependent methyltransferase n=1 Tax=Diplocloster agilis TaxID=2850323 RepID=UPI000820E87B|nr:MULTISPECIES: class I SAM-dependent methyltransferase [Lachnospiraceae]MBU9743492.1 class I SAM-dependent methyltransferase [Diplocloster agilis]MCU6734827.1 class I SAM-dependent methyltransferase [Suonthocola fibrivorans]SCJ55708.1 Cypemycin methyltransferase [uncultured Clostridium sp.]